LFGQLKKPDEALAHAKQALEIWRALALRSADEFNLPLSRSLIDLAFYLRDAGKWDEALAPAQEAVQLYQGMVLKGSDPPKKESAYALFQLGEIFAKLGRDAESLAASREGILALRNVLDESPKSLRSLMNDLVELYSKASRAVGVQPDSALLGPILEKIRQLKADSER
jgi:tetratricopeptide (TPR) repeat protein